VDWVSVSGAGPGLAHILLAAPVGKCFSGNVISRIRPGFRTPEPNSKSMKSIFAHAMLAALVASASAYGQTEAKTTPVGYVTEALKAGQFNLIGLTTHQPVIASGVLDAESASSVTDSEVNFTTTLTAGATYILELDGGVTQEVNAWSGSALTTPNLTSFVVPATTTYKLRKAPTIADIFGASNSAGLQAVSNFNPQQADLIYLPNGTGGFDRYFYSNAAGQGASGWFNADTFAGGSNVPVVYADGVLLYRRGLTDLSIVLSGEIKKAPTALYLIANQFNYVGGVYPVGSTLDNSGLGAGLTPTSTFNPAQADLVYIPDGAGGYSRYFYSNAAGQGASGWFNASDFSTSGSVSLKSGIIILRRGATAMVTIVPPAGYAGL
jgi:hypothetical protein